MLSLDAVKAEKQGAGLERTEKRVSPELKDAEGPAVMQTVGKSIPDTGNSR